MMMENPSPSISWSMWAQGTAVFLITAADANADGVLSPMEIEHAFPKLGKNPITNSTGYADFEKIAFAMGNVGSLLFGHGFSADYVSTPALVGILYGMLDRNQDDALSLMELSPLCISEGLFRQVRHQRIIRAQNAKSCAISLTTFGLTSNVHRLG